MLSGTPSTWRWTSTAGYIAGWPRCCCVSSSRSVRRGRRAAARRVADRDLRAGEDRPDGRGVRHRHCAPLPERSDLAGGVAAGCGLAPPGWKDCRMVNSAYNSSGSSSLASTTNPPVITAMVTPVDPAGSIDHDGLDRVVDRVLAGGVHGVSPCGSTGEGARLTLDQRLEVARRVRARAPQATVIPGVPVTAMPLAHEELAELGRLDVTAALVPPPSY